MSTFWIALAVVAVIALGAWLVSLLLRNVGIVDSLWSLMFLACGVVYTGTAVAAGPRGIVVLCLLTIWAVRLSAYITWRNLGEGEDPRYAAMRRRNEPGFAVKSLYLVFGLQALLAWLISMPLQPAIASASPLGLLDALAVLLWLTGFVFEAVGDRQLARFKADPDNAGKVLRQGLWRYTRHPNYFGDFCVWWAFWLFALAAGAWWTVFAPVLMSFLLLRVSGVALLEKTIGKRRPEYADYIASTNAFFPGPPRSTESNS